MTVPALPQRFNGLFVRVMNDLHAVESMVPFNGLIC